MPSYDTDFHEQYSKDSIGEHVLTMMSKLISKNMYHTIIEGLLYNSKESTSEIQIFFAPNALIIEKIKNKYSIKMAELFEIKTGVYPSLEFILDSNITNEKRLHKTSNKYPVVPVQIDTFTNAITEVKTISEKGDRAKIAFKSNLNSFQTFNTFVTGESNKFAYLVSEKVSTSPGVLYNPLFLFGNVGLGKTHLMNAIGNVLEGEGKKVLYISIEEFLNEFTKNIKFRSMEHFRNKFREIDALLIDDVQFLNGKDKLQEELFHTFEALKNADKQIVFTADQHPKKIEGLEKRLQSRFQWGLAAEISNLELETKVAIIRQKCSLNKITLSEDVISLIATSTDANAREIEGIISKITAYMSLLLKEITLESVYDILKNELQLNIKSSDFESLLKAIAYDYNVKPSEILSRTRYKNVVSARRVLIYLTREITKMSMAQIAVKFSMKDHTTVSHNLKKTISDMHTNEEFKNKIDYYLKKFLS